MIDFKKMGGRRGVGRRAMGKMEGEPTEPQIRKPKPESRKKAESRNPKKGRFNSGFGFRPSFGLRSFGFRVRHTFATGFS